MQCCAVAGAAIVGGGIAAAVLLSNRAGSVGAAAAPPAASTPKPHVRTRPRLVLPRHVAGAGRLPKPKPRPKPKRPPEPAATHITHGPTVTPSLYEHTTSPRILRGQGCRAGRARTDGLVVLDFGKLAYRPGLGYGTITFADRFASNLSVGWAAKSYARGYSDCLPNGSRARITLAIGTSNYRQDVPSTYVAGRLWARQTMLLGAYLKVHHFDRVTAAAGDDVEPAWDPSFRRTYDFFRGFGSVHSGYLLYNYGSLDGGVGTIWKLRQAYYVAGGMHAARAVPEIYNRTMAEQWAELARLSLHRYGKPIKIAGLMTQHTRHCSGCGYTAKQAHKALVHELAKHPKTKVRYLAAATNIGAPAPVSPRDLSGPRR